MKINGNEIPKEVMAKAITCETPEELMKLAEEQGITLTVEQAEAYLAEMEEIDLDSEQLRQAAGGMECWMRCEIRDKSNREIFGDGCPFTIPW